MSQEMKEIVGILIIHPLGCSVIVVNETNEHKCIESNVMQVGYRYMNTVHMSETCDMCT